MPEPTHHAFLGYWQLVPESCRYQQGSPPQAGSIEITELPSGELVFRMDWVDSEGKPQRAEYAGPPDGSHQPFPGGDLADTMVTRAVSERELTTAALWRGKERMVAQRQLDTTLQSMRVTQLVRLPDGTSPADVGVYVRMASA